MRKAIIAAFSCCLLFLSCYDVNEEVLIRDNGSGHYSTRIDMSGLIEMIQAFGSEADLAKDGLDRPVDTVIMLRSMIDSSQKLTADEKALMETGKMHMVMNLPAKAFTIDMDFDFRNNADLQFLLAGAGSGGFSQALKNVLQNDKKDQSQPDSPKDLEVDQLNNIYDVTVSNGIISKKINRAKLDSIMQRPEVAQMKQMGAAQLEILYTTNIILPRPVKKINCMQFTISNDKKKLTIRNNLMDVFEKPELFEYNIDY